MEVLLENLWVLGCRVIQLHSYWVNVLGCVFGNHRIHKWQFIPVLGHSKTFCSRIHAVCNCCSAWLKQKCFINILVNDIFKSGKDGAPAGPGLASVHGVCRAAGGGRGAVPLDALEDGGHLCAGVDLAGEIRHGGTLLHLSDGQQGRHGSHCRTT